jgi:sodium bicarbonate transporter 10
MTNSGLLAADAKEKVKEALLRRHRHQHEKESKKSRESNIGRLPIIRSLTEIGKNHSNVKCEWDSVVVVCFHPSISCMAC